MYDDDWQLNHINDKGDIISVYRLVIPDPNPEFALKT